MEIKREIKFFGDYFEDFFKKLDNKTKNKIDEILYFISILDTIPSKYLKKIINSKTCMKLESSTEVTFIGYFAVLMMIS